MLQKNELLCIERPKRLGIVGGLGPETSFRFALRINNKFRDLTNCQPEIVLEHLAVPGEVERRLINGEKPVEMFDLILKAVKQLNEADVDFIVVPCNTAHVFIEELRKHSEKPIISITEECAKECKQRNLRKVGLLASTTSIKERLHAQELEKFGIDVILPADNELEKVSSIIVKIVHNKADNGDKQFLIKVIGGLKEQGAEAVILGCTDLGLFISQNEVDLPLVDTCSILENAAIKLLSQNIMGVKENGR